ncbi:MAG TPA: sugar phosphate nucleotidyltransferase [Bryobacteraceae bacterium]|nr:sugar phosphate nucleotidyltransferase [Bryobacteraceae bacterium]
MLGIVLAGGKGTRLYPLTKERAKPAVPFGGKYRIIDFVLSNFINSGIYSVYVLTQFKSQSLLQHLSEGWQFAHAFVIFWQLSGHFTGAEINIILDFRAKAYDKPCREAASGLYFG